MKDPEFTGERFVPGQGGNQLAYEHLHRYAFALRWARNKDVLDIATGVGYGASALASVARRVWALDLDQGALEYARRIHSDQNVCFIRADCGQLPFRPASMGLVVAMEILEHIEDQDTLLQQISRVLQTDGLLLISTPNKAAYSDYRHYKNPFHVRELYRDELLQLLGKHFSHVQLMQQKVRAGSLIETEENSAGGDEVLRAAAAPAEAPTEALYYIAACSSRPLSVALPRASVYVDRRDGLLTEWEERLLQDSAEISRLNEEISKLGAWTRQLQERLDEKDEVLRRVLGEVEMRDDTIRSLQSEMQQEIARRDDTIGRLQRELEERTRWAIDLQTTVEARDKSLEQTQKKLGETDAELRRVAERLSRVREAFFYRVLCRLGILPK